MDTTRRRSVTTDDHAQEGHAQDGQAGADDALPADDGEMGDVETGDGEADDEKGPLRRCIVTRERLPKETLIRFVIGPDRTVVPDTAAKLPGRGIWLSARGDVIETACSRGAFARAARSQVTVPPDLSAVLQASLARRVGEYLGLARRAGQAVSGFQKAREWLQGGHAALVVQASDGSPDERSRFLAGWTERVPVIAPLTAQELGTVFGRDHAVHVAVSPGRLADSLLHEAARLAGVRTSNGAASGTTPAHVTSPGTVGRSIYKAPGDVSRADGVKADR